MDKERAKFILQSFRPDGADASEPAFAEALSLATEDRELGEWLSAERAQDARFAEMLDGVTIPDDLREAVFAVLSEAPVKSDDLDALFIGGLADIAPPASLRDEILAAMEVEQKVVEMPRKRSTWRRAAWGMSAAAVVALMGVVGFGFFAAGGSALAGATPAQVQLSAIEMLESPFFALNVRNDRQAELYEWLEGQDLPSPDQLPAGLQGVPGIGCKLLTIGESESRGSLICYRKDGQIVHLVMMEKEAISVDNMPDIGSAGSTCRKAPENDDWAVTGWADSQHTFFLLSKMEKEELAKLF